MRFNPYIPHHNDHRSEPRLSRMVVVSLLIHLLGLGLFSGVLLPRIKTPPRPVYIVDLVNKPVKNPRSGRPDVRPKTEQDQPKPTVAAPEPKPDAVKLPPKPEAKPQPETKPEPKPTPRAEAKPAATKPKPSAKPQVTAKEEQSLADAMDKMKRKQEIQDLQNKLAAMAAKDTRTAGPDIPLGMPEGTGTEEGVSTDAWLHEFLKQAWRLSKYQLGRTDLAAEVQLTFDGKGRLLTTNFLQNPLIPVSMIRWCAPFYNSRIIRKRPWPTPARMSSSI